MKRGFTLIELLGIIVVLGIIATIVTPVIQSTLAQNQESVYNTLVKQIEGNANESYVTVTKKGNNYTFETTIHDLTDADEVVSGAPTIILAGSSNETIASGSNYNLEKKDNVSRQIIFNGKEVSSIDTSVKGVYEVYYSKLENGKLGITIKTVKVN